jgi:hypothetical protein
MAKKATKASKPAASGSMFYGADRVKFLGE